MKAVCVFAGSSPGMRDDYAEAARSLARELAARGHALVYGGGNVGLMGILAQTAMDHGGRVIGVIPEALMKREVADYSISDLKIVNSMHERKALMSELSNGVIALPGGLGTLEELLEMLTWSQLGIHGKPVALFNVAGYYDPLLAFLDQAVTEGFIGSRHRGLLLTGTEPGPLLDAMYNWRTPNLGWTALIPETGPLQFSGKNEIVRTSILSRGGASAAEVGSSKAVWPVHCTRPRSESNNLKTSTSSGCIRGA